MGHSDLLDIRNFSNRPDPWHDPSAPIGRPKATARTMVKEGLENLKPADQIALLMSALDIPSKRLLLQELYRGEILRSGYSETQLSLRAALTKNFFTAESADAKRGPDMRRISRLKNLTPLE